MLIRTLLAAALVAFIILLAALDAWQAMERRDCEDAGDIAIKTDHGYICAQRARGREA